MQVQTNNFKWNIIYFELIELRRRNVANAGPSPAGPLQKATSVPSLTESPVPSPQRKVGPSDPSSIHTPNLPQRANSMSNLEGSAGKYQ